MKKILTYIVFLLTATSLASAQTPCFTSSVTRGCAPLFVTMTDCSGSSGVWYTYGDGTMVDDPSPTHTYATPGLYSVTQKITIPGSTLSATKVNYIEVLAPKQPAFKLDVCAGYNVTLTVTDNIDTAYVVNFGGGDPTNYLVKQNIPFTHTYTSTAQSTINITPFSCGLAVNTKVYPIQSIIKPDIASVVVNNQHPSNGHITVNFNAETNQRYYLQQSINNNGSYVNIDTLSQLSGPQSIDLFNLNTQSSQYCYRLLAYDDCNPPVPSEEICSILNDVTAGNNQNTINWSNHIAGNVASYQLYDKNYAPIPGATTSPYTDSPVNCGVNYCYTVIAQLTQTSPLSGPLLSISNTSCVTGTSTNIPPAIQNLNSAVSGNSVELSWDNPAGAVSGYSISRSVNGAAYTSYKSYTNPITNSFKDNGVAIPGNTYCYMVTYRDECNNLAPSSNSTCPLILTVTGDNTNSMINHLSWSPYTGGWPSGSQTYIIEKLDENNNVVETINAGSSLSYSDDLTGTTLKVVRYRILAVPGGPVVNSPYSNIVEVKYELEVHLPNAFTPNGDGNNDFFMAKGKFIDEFKLTVFNRWGEVVYTSNDFNDEGWNGTYQNTPALNDVYAYLVEAKDRWGNKIVKRGSVTLLR